MSMTYSDLYTLVNNEIQKNVAFGGNILTGKDANNRNQVIGGGVGTTPANAIVDTAAIMNSVMDLMLHTIPPQIKSGLCVKQTPTPSDRITISPGEGTVGGRIFKLNLETTYTVPFDSATAVWYINFGTDGINISKTPIFGKLTIAKIVVPRPGVTAFIRDDRDVTYNPWDAWIVNYREYKIFGNDAGKFEEDTVDLLRDNIGDILADNLIGNIRLSEDLKITNTQGSLEIDSKSINMFDADAHKIATFNRKGTFFYDVNGIELAKFSVDGAKIGNINITTNSIQSGNFASGALGQGFQILDSGDAEFNNVLIRGKMTSSVFQKESVSAIGGNLLVMDADILDADMTSADSATLAISGDTSFEVGDILRIKDGVDDEWFEVVSVNINTYTVTRDKGSQYSADQNPAWTKGVAVINYGQSGEGGIFLSSSEANSPFMSVLTHEGEPWSAITNQLRIGNLNGFLDYATDLYGLAVGDINSYLKYDPVNGLRIRGDITITGGDAAVTFVQEIEPGSSGDAGEPKVGDIWYVPSTGYSYVYVESSGASFSWEEMSGGAGGITDANGMINVAATPAGAGLYLGASYMGYYSGATWQSFIKSDGTFQFSGDASNYLTWNGAALTVSGVVNVLGGNWSASGDATKIDGGEIYTATINASSIVANSITASQIQASSITATELNVSTLSAITADMGSLTAGSIVGGTIKTAATGARVEMFPDANTGLVIYDDASGTGNEVFKAVVGGTDVGDISIGDYAGDAGLLWDQSLGTFNVKGAMTISGGSFSGTVSFGSNSEVEIDGANEIIKVFSTTITITAGVNDGLDWIENSTTEAATLTAGTSYTPTTLAAHVQTKMRAEGDANTTVTYNSTTKKITIANSTLTTLTLKWSSGTNADTNCGEALGFDITADDTGALTYESDYPAALRVEIGKLL